MIYELVLRSFDCSLEFVFSLLLLQPFNFSPVSFACNFQDWGCVILREIDFLLKIYWSIPCLHPSWKVHTWIEICANLNHRKKMKADGSRLIPRKHTETLVLLNIEAKSLFWQRQPKICRKNPPNFLPIVIGFEKQWTVSAPTLGRQGKAKLYLTLNSLPTSLV